MLIQNPQRASQLKDFSGMRYGSMYPTDVDCILEYKNIGYIIIELKMEGVKLPVGQRLALERMVSDFGKSGKKALLIIGTHNQVDCSQPIDVANCTAKSFFYSDNKKWRVLNHSATVKEISDKFISSLRKN